MNSFNDFANKIKTFFTETIANDYLSLILQFLMLSVLFYYVFKVLKNYKGEKLIPIVTFVILFTGITLSLSAFDNLLSLIVYLMIALLVFTMFHTEIKRTFLDAGVKKTKKNAMETTGVGLIMDEITRAVQSMSKKNVGALIVLSNENLPEGIIETGTVVDAKITAQMVEAVFYPKAPLHDGAMIIEGSKIYAAGCFLPLSQSETLPKDMGSRHRAALGVTTVASVTAIVVSEETGIISIVKNGAVKKKYADASDIKNALSDYYWSDLTAEGKL